MMKTYQQTPKCTRKVHTTSRRHHYIGLEMNVMHKIQQAARGVCHTEEYGDTAVLDRERSCMQRPGGRREHHHRAKPVTDSGLMQDSEPPHTAASASPVDISRAASIMLCAPAAHAVIMEWFGPLSPCLIAIWALAMFERTLGTKKGETLRELPDSTRAPEETAMKKRGACEQTRGM